MAAVLPPRPPRHEDEGEVMRIIPLQIIIFEIMILIIIRMIMIILIIMILIVIMVPSLSSSFVLLNTVVIAMLAVVDMAYACAQEKSALPWKYQCDFFIAVVDPPAVQVSKPPILQHKKVATILFEQLFELFSVGFLFSSKLFELIQVAVIFVVVILVGPKVAPSQPPAPFYASENACQVNIYIYIYIRIYI